MADPNNARDFDHHYQTEKKERERAEERAEEHRDAESDDTAEQQNPDAT